MVNRAGRRFANEGSAYNELAKSFSERDGASNEYANQPAWAIFDGQYRERYPVLTVMPGDPDPDWLVRADTLDALAVAAGIDASGLRETVERWNGFVVAGKDADFGRHRTPFDLQAPHHSIGTIEQPPFYALPVYQGTLGTKGGQVTNRHAQVLGTNGETVPGLYAAGNVMASAAGPAYYGGGATIGLAMTFGYIAGKHAAAILRGD
jgi:succinate dehydrogenase/fumarate reductase flavoprotein subunit